MTDSAMDITAEPIAPDASVAWHRPRIDFNSILAVLNPLIAIATLTAYDQVGVNAYLDGDTILLTMLLAVQTQIVLFIERRRREPFVILVTFTLILYYSLRVLTLLLCAQAW